MNAYDEPGGSGGVVLDVVRHPSMFRTHLLGPSEGNPTLERWHLDGNGGAVKEERLDDHGQEFPRVDERVVGRPHRYGYAVAVGTSDDIVGTESMLVCHDFERGTTVERSFGRGAGVGEAVFVPRTEDADGGRRMAAHARLLAGQGHLGALRPQRSGPGRRATGRGRAPAARPGRIPRQLGAGPILSQA